MNNEEFSRRDFQRLTLAAFSGMVLGAGLQPAAATAEDEKEEERKSLLEEPHVCRGLNVCKGKGRGGDNACAGQGKCGNVAAHDCKGMNACKGNGGCGE